MPSPRSRAGARRLTGPLYHIHKWWAQRLGTVFRAMVIGAFAPSGADLFDLFYKPVRINDAVVFDPFMGSGTTIGEALKLGVRGIGARHQPPWPIFLFAMRWPFTTDPRSWRHFELSSATLRIRCTGFTEPFSRTAPRRTFSISFGSRPPIVRPVLKPSNCFSSYIFARHAYPRRYPEAQALCPACGAVNEIRNDAREARCGECRTVFDPHAGPAPRAKGNLLCL